MLGAMAKSALTVGQLGEAGLLARIRRVLGRNGPGVVIGIGDDAAITQAIGPHAAMSADVLVEDVDFCFDWASWNDVGHKAAAVNLSDLAAMGATPRGLLLSLGLRPQDRVRDVMALMRSFARLGERFGAPLVGGDLSRTDGPLVVAVTVFGQVQVRRALRRHRASGGDRLLVSGTLGSAAAGLLQLQEGTPRGGSLARRQLRPLPQIALGLALARWGKVRSCLDISDGLASDVLRLLAPGCAAEIDLARLPLSRALRKAVGDKAGELALCGGEDFELALAVRPRDVLGAHAVAQRVGARLTEVGRVLSGRGLKLLGTRSSLRGWDHFSDS